MELTSVGDYEPQNYHIKTNTLNNVELPAKSNPLLRLSLCRQQLIFFI